MLSRVSRALPSLDELTLTERIELVQDLWDDIASDPDRVPVTQAQRAELDRRIEDHRADPDDCADWATVKSRLRR